MSGARQPRQRRGNPFLTPTIMTLTFWQLRRTWFLLLFMTLGMIAAIVIACAIPLLSDVMKTAGLRSTLRATPDSTDFQLTDGNRWDIKPNRAEGRAPLTGEKVRRT